MALVVPYLCGLLKAKEINLPLPPVSQGDTWDNKADVFEMQWNQKGGH